MKKKTAKSERGADEDKPVSVPGLVSNQVDILVAED